MLNVAINGFGRIGRSALKLILQNKKLRLVAINDLGDINNLAYLLKFDSVQGRYEKQVKIVGDNLVVGITKIPVSKEMDPAKLPWKKIKVDVVLECTGVFTKKEDAEKHLKAGAKKVIISAMSKSEGVVTVVRGVNDSKAKNQKIVANASCTTNCVAPLMAVLDENFGVEKSLLTTVHATTASQRTVDLTSAKDWREGRAVSGNIIPSTTGAAIATALTLPQLKDKFDGISLRVPILCGSISDIVLITEKKTTVEEVNKAFIKAAKSPRFKGIIEVSEDELVSSDILGTTASAIVDLQFTRVIGGNLVKVLAWYDNEWGYANRLVEMISKI
ncbi:MAG: Glyceraldehyde-3-phosphate dehydrogenase, type I [Parcubacteria group bacterium GW2011_GWC2_39_14]|nr:MAG: Glyceraldehyde-3-phosphate dehydrogenase, type I [Parcubacteria group bacterium GW2011_GWC2_39_14]KKR54809.1 MAG: Glyceraldehyde-3-phosphate dehydrogenase, type I [Parcubacteria group bacterium GW2011_GWA2_40_23]